MASVLSSHRPGVILLLSAMLLGACGQSQLPAASQAQFRNPGGVLKLREAAPTSTMARAAQKALSGLTEANELYKKAGLSRGGARRLGPQNAQAVKQSVQIVAEKLAQLAQALEQELALGTENEVAWGRNWAAKKPLVGSQLKPDDDLASSLYRVAQWRLKLSALIEEAYLRGALTAEDQAKLQAAKQDGLP